MSKTPSYLFSSPPLPIVGVGNTGQRISHQFWISCSKLCGFSEEKPYLPAASGRAVNLPKLETLFLNPEKSTQGRMLGSKVQKWAPRNVMVDCSFRLPMEVAEAYRKGFYLEDTHVPRGSTGAANCMGDGYYFYKSSPEWQKNIFSEIERVTGLIHTANGLMIIHSLGGGTGSGVGSALLEDIRTKYPSLPNVISVGILPNPEIDNVPDPFASINTTLVLYSMMKYTNWSILFDNKAIGKLIPEIVLDDQGGLKNKLLGKPVTLKDYYDDINRVIARFISCFTNLFVFDSRPAADLGNIRTIMGTRKEGRSKLLVPSLSPFGNETYDPEEEEIVSVSKDCFDYNHVLVDLEEGQGTIVNLANAYMIVAHEIPQKLVGQAGLKEKILDRKFNFKTRRGEREPFVFGMTQSLVPYQQVAALLKTKSISARLTAHIQVAEDEIAAKTPEIEQYTNEYLSMDEIEKRVKYVKDQLS